MARPKLGGDSERLNMVISSAEMKSIEDWRFANRIASKSEAIRRLCQTGLAFDAKADSLSKAASSTMKTVVAAAKAIVGRETETLDDIKDQVATLASLRDIARQQASLVASLEALAEHAGLLRDGADIARVKAYADEVERLHLDKFQDEIEEKPE